MGTMSDASIALIRVIERWEIIDPRMKVFQTAINVAMHDVSDAFHHNYFPRVMTLLPIDLPQGGIIPWQPPAQPELDRLEELETALSNACGTFGCYADDFLREMQRALLGDLFESEPETRKPLDPTCKVIRLEDYEALQQYFNTETAWGRVKARAEANALSKVKAASAAIGGAP